MKKSILVLAVAAITLSLIGCRAIFIPKKQNVTISTDNNNSEIYVNDYLFTDNKTATKKIEKDGVKQIVLKTPGYKDEYAVLLPGRKVHSYYPLLVLDIPSIILTYMMAEVLVDQKKTRVYEQPANFSSKLQDFHKTDNHKFFRLTNIGLEFKDFDEDFQYYSLKHEDDIYAAIHFAEIEKKESDKLKAEKESKKKSKKKSSEAEKSLLDEDNKTMNFEDTKFSYEVFETMKRTGFIDTVNTIFKDEFNTLFLEGSIKKIKRYTIKSVASHYYHKAGLEITWYIKNVYGEKIDSIETTDYSGDFAFVRKAGFTASSLPKLVEERNKFMEKMFQDAMNVSYYKLFENETFKKHLEREDPNLVKYEALTINRPTNKVHNLASSSIASIIVKNGDKSHGSGYAISNDGYLLTNYHVIVGDVENDFKNLKILLADGTELKPEVVRFSRSKDIALLKVNNDFEYAFEIPSEKKYANLEEVYTVGAPKSIELGQSVSNGLLSNERNAHGAALLQLSMSVNPGNSGGPLFKKDGELYGTIKSKLVGYATEGIGFAVPAYMTGEYLNITY